MNNKKVWVNGCFDVMHMGHIRLLQYARGLGSHLRVGIDGDDRVRELKGRGRPFNNQESRASFLMALSCVDEVVIFNSDIGLIDEVIEYDPMVIVIGDEYKDIGHPASSHVSSVSYFNKIPGFSTSSILEGFKANEE